MMHGADNDRPSVRDKLSALRQQHTRRAMIRHRELMEY